MGYRVVQWTTGHVGREAAKAILRHPQLELIGCYAWSKEKEGRDVGELCGIESTGICATHDVDALLALQPDCVCYTPNQVDPSELARLLAAGVNVACSYFVNGRTLGDEARAKLAAAASSGNASLFGAGIFPGFANFIAAMMATASSNFQKIRFLESVDLSQYDAIANYTNLGWAEDPDEKWREINRMVLGQYAECVDVMADMLRIPLREVSFDYEPAVTPEERTIKGFTMPQGSIAGQKCTWRGMVGDLPVIELEVVWNAGKGLEPEWPVAHGYTMEVHGNPNIHTRVRFSPSQEQIDSGRIADLANPVTAMPVVNAIPSVCDAAAGIRTYADLPLITGYYTGDQTGN
ncbi:MAG: dihydrodipicolinate reductase [Deltaproteobacteria bacterium]|nr:dihydrodipicolinate reductase [Deltaproteobacteria bacterium]MBW2419596.1 dihydrodipicolinate reductase [Deltaproteobacteria bacterium]